MTPSDDTTGLSDAPFLTADVPAIGGRIKSRPEDFLVEEIPRYEPCGEGEHVYLLVEKRGMSTSAMLDVIARHFGVRMRQLGYAGMKDKLAITRQVVSVHVPGRTPEDFPMLEHDRISILWTDLHTNKLRRGHLAGNRFSIRIRDVDPGRVLDAHRVLRSLASAGMANLYGEQRFGRQHNTHELGRLLLLRRHEELLDVLLGPCPGEPDLNAEARRLYTEGRYEEAIDGYPRTERTERRALAALARGRAAAAAVDAVGEIQRVFWVAAFQSAIFNRVCAERMRAGLLGALRVGDVAVRHEGGAVFLVGEDDAAAPATAERLARLEISPTGPMWGPKMLAAEGETRADEERAFAAAGVPDDVFERAVRSMGDNVSGTRRALRVPVIDPQVEAGADEHGHYIRCAFELPPGSYATMVLREVIKPAPETVPAGAADDG